MVRFLTHPVLSSLLMTLGLLGIIIEIRTPGFGVPGTVGVASLGLFFWGHYLVRLAGWEVLLLLALGVGLLGVELFVLPGFGVFGLGGGALVIVSLLLASQTFIVPQNSYQFAQFQTSLMVLAGAAIGTIVLAVILNRWLPEAPLIGEMIRKPVEGQEVEDLRRRESTTAPRAAA